MTFINQFCVPKFRHSNEFEMPKFRHYLWTKILGKKSKYNAKDKKSVLHAASPAHNADGYHLYICL